MTNSLLINAPETVAWLVGIVLAALMIRREGSKTEKLFLAGCSLMLANKLLGPFVSEFVRSMTSNKESNLDIARTMVLFYSLPLTILSIAGLVCLVWAFWVRFSVGKGETA